MNLSDKMFMEKLYQNSSIQLNIFLDYDSNKIRFKST